jgi:putative FmdB family regulatory protein
MPTYEYVCKNCGERLEAVQSFHDEALSTCPHCGGDLKKVFGSVGIVFKGSGFYKNDSRNSTASVTPPSSTDTKTESSTSPTPAPASTSSESPAKPAAPAAPSSPTTSPA